MFLRLAKSGRGLQSTRPWIRQSWIKDNSTTEHKDELLFCYHYLKPLSPINSGINNVPSQVLRRTLGNYSATLQAVSHLDSEHILRRCLFL